VHKRSPDKIAAPWQDDLPRGVAKETLNQGHNCRHKNVKFAATQKDNDLNQLSEKFAENPCGIESVLQI
jgi:hypothetical protein